jgi:hypothetical protein
METSSYRRGCAEGGEGCEQGEASVSSAKRDVLELVGCAVNASALELREGRELPLDRVAALGGAAHRIATGADLAGLPVAAMGADLYRRSADLRQLMLDPGTPDQRDILAGELCPNLIHIREGRQFHLLPRTIKLFALWLQPRRLFAELKTTAELELLERFAEQVLHEWLSDKCTHCGGTGKLERLANGRSVRPRGSMQRNATFIVCTGCMGNGRSRPSPAMRKQRLGISYERYEAERWKQRFGAALVWVDHLLHRRIRRPLTAELGRSTKRI